MIHAPSHRRPLPLPLPLSERYRQRFLTDCCHCGAEENSSGVIPLPNPQRFWQRFELPFVSSVRFILKPPSNITSYFQTLSRLQEVSALVNRVWYHWNIQAISNTFHLPANTHLVTCHSTYIPLNDHGFIIDPIFNSFSPSPIQPTLILYQPSLLLSCCSIFIVFTQLMPVRPTTTLSTICQTISTSSSFARTAC